MDDLRLRRLKLRDLHVLDAVAEAGSMAKAAPRLGMSQPAVSRVVAELEHLLGVPLFDRTATGVELTRFGEAMRRRTATVADERCLTGECTGVNVRSEIATDKHSFFDAGERVCSSASNQCVGQNLLKVNCLLNLVCAVSTIQRIALAATNQSVVTAATLKRDGKVEA